MIIHGDTHFHSTDSDGSKTNPERIDQIIQIDPKHTGVWAVTNHDMYSPGFVRPARERGIQAVWATEISARSAEWNHSFHVTCYSPTLSSEISSMAEKILQGKEQKVRLQIEKLAASGLPISSENFFSWIQKEGFSPSNISNGHLAEFLWDRGDTVSQIANMTRGKVNTKKKFLHECLKASGEFRNIGYVPAPPYEPDIHDLVQVANIEGAILSIAHPNFSFTKFSREKFGATTTEESVCEKFQDNIVPYFSDIGMKNFEINASASPRWVGIIQNAVKRTGGLITFGSDNHGAPEASDTHGKFGVQNPLLTEDMVRKTREKLLEFV